MAITWEEARTKLRGDLWRSGTQGIPNDVCDRALHVSLLELEGERRWAWLENVRTSADLEEAADRLAAPLDIASVTSIAYLSGATGYDILGVRPLPTVREMARGTSAGAPSFYAIHDGTLYFDTVVPEGAEFEIVYTARTPEDLEEAVAEGDSNVTLAKHEHAVLKRAAEEVCLGYLKNTDEAARQNAAYQRSLQRLMDAEDAARGDLYGGLIVPDNSYQSMAGDR